MDVSDKLYAKYKDVADKKGYAVTKLNQIIFEKALRDWILEMEKQWVYICDVCGIHTDKAYYIYKYNQDAYEECETLCESCFHEQRKGVPKD